eukprot:scaffold1151_cov126-Isochrysis_galbana.AAC.11
MAALRRPDRGALRRLSGRRACSPWSGLWLCDAPWRRNRPELESGGEHINDFAGLERLILSVGCGVLAGGVGGASTASRLGSRVEAFWLSWRRYWLGGARGAEISRCVRFPPAYAASVPLPAPGAPPIPVSRPTRTHPAACSLERTLSPQTLVLPSQVPIRRIF